MNMRLFESGRGIWGCGRGGGSASDGDGGN